jgi:hypothetical protein
MWRYEFYEGLIRVFRMVNPSNLHYYYFLVTHSFASLPFWH